MTTVTKPEALAFPCPIERCGAAAGEECHTPQGRYLPWPKFAHAPRIDRARHEQRGPQHLEVVYVEGLKYRVASAEPLKLQRGNSHTLFGGIAREDLTYDPIAGMWRVKP